MKRGVVNLLFLAFGVNAFNVIANSYMKAKVEDPHYGVALYELYQGNYQNALTEFAIAETNGSIQHQGVDARLVKAGAAFSYGLHLSAANDFKRLLDEKDLGLLNYANLQLAKVYFTRGEISHAEQFINEISLQSLDEQWRDEFHYLKGRISLALQQFNLAESALSQLPSDNPLHDYLAHNLLLVASQQQITPTLPKTPITALDDEQLALLDRSFLAIGYSALEKQLGEQAELAFSQVSQQSIWLNEALYGLAASQLLQSNYAKALYVLEMVITSEQGNVFTQHQALTAKAHVLLSEAKFQLALDAIEHAEKRFAEFNAELNTVNTNLQNSAVLLAMLNSTEQQNQYQSALHSVFVSDEFYEKNEQLKSLLQLKEQFKSQQRALENYAEILAEKAARQERIIETTNLTSYEARLSAQKAELTTLSTRLAEAKASRTGLMTADELKINQRIVNAEKRLSSLSQNRNMQSQQARLTRLKGILLWQQDYLFDERYQAHANQLLVAQTALQEATRQYQKSSQLIQTGQDYNRISQQLNAIKAQLSTRQQQANSLINQQLDEIQILLLEDVKESQAFLSDDVYKLKVMRSIALEGLASHNANSESVLP
ncbi:hypothetical protein [Pseudoalteromonas sp. G4]|uniref:hypothetical protein n=1 Tax=Pseudoalteromonas sp. G4 TaxID=2992761 RepID=UPI00237E85D8|nr:hypothetical protein [Pseudoalteromonas sp. G4]MDE3272498.1 hypothetical protein [Pseudoalteromonas sp. G4]